MSLRRAPMIGRHHLLTALQLAVSEARTGHPAVVLVEGEAGLGKTRLVAEFLDGLEEDPETGELLVLRGTCSSADRREVPWGPFLDVLRDLRRHLGTEAFLELAGPRATELSALDPGIPVEAPPVGPDRGRLLRVLSGLLLDAVTDHPTVLVIEDLQWADDASRRVLEYLARSVRREPLVLVLTIRTGEASAAAVPELADELVRSGSASRLRLDRLDRDQIAELLTHLHGARPGGLDLDGVVELSAGVPLLVEEIADAARSGVDLSQLSGRLNGHRLAGLEPPTLEVVETAAVARTPPRAVVLLAATDLPGEDVDAALAAAVRAGVLTRHGALVEFRHAVLREATLERMLPHRERELHQRWADVLEPEIEGLESAVAVAHHRLAAAEATAALVACARAADLAGRASGFAVQLEMLREVARLWPQVENPEELAGRDLVEVLGQSAEAAFYASADSAETQRLAREAVSLLTAASPPARRAWLDLLVLRSRYRQGDQVPVEELLVVTRRIPEEPPSRQRVVACVTAADELLEAGRPGDAEPYAQEGARSAEILGLAQLEADAARTEALLHLHRGEFERAVHAAVRACRLADAAGDPISRADSLQILALVLWNLGELVGATENCRLAVELLGGDRPGPSPDKWAMNATNLAEALIEQGDWTGAEGLLDRVLAVPELRSRATDFALRLSRQLRVWRDGVDPHDDVGAVLWDPDIGEENVGLQDRIPGRYTDADISSHRRDLVRARAALRSPLADDRTTQLPEALYLLLGVAARTEADARAEGWPDPDPDAGAWVVGRVRHLLDLMTPGGPVSVAQDAHVRADLARWAGGDDVATWAHVVALWRRVPYPRPLAMALQRLGSVAAAGHERQIARDALAEALRVSERLGARPLTASIQQVARDHALRIGPGSDASGDPIALTTRELEVLRLVAEGASNGEVGERLFISPRTVSVHVSHILDKLGVGSRTAAATVAHTAGLLRTDDPNDEARTGSTAPRTSR